MDMMRLEKDMLKEMGNPRYFMSRRENKQIEIMLFMELCSVHERKCGGNIEKYLVIRVVTR